MAFNKLNRAVAVVSGLAIGTTVMLTFFVVWAVGAIRDQDQQLGAIIDAVDDEEVAVSWTLTPQFTEATANTEPMEFVGDFQCAPSILETGGVFLQFQGAISGFVSGVPTLARETGLPVEAEKVCNQGPVEFSVSWDSIGNTDAMTDPNDYRLIIEVEAEGYETSRAESDPFILHPPQ